VSTVRVGTVVTKTEVVVRKGLGEHVDGVGRELRLILRALKEAAYGEAA
jgi:hypothetical protein